MGGSEATGRARERGSGPAARGPLRCPAMTGSAEIGLVWFRRDLRLDDNPAWAAATSGHPFVVPLFVIDPRLIDAAGPYRRRQLLATVQALDYALAQAGGRLLIRIGDPVRLVPETVSALGVGAVYWNADVTPFACTRDDKVEAALQVPVERWWGSLVHAPGRVLTAKGTLVDGVFTPFYKTWSATTWDDWPEPGEATLLDDPGEPMPTLDGPAPMFEGENEAQLRLVEFLERVDSVRGRPRPHRPAGARRTCRPTCASARCRRGWSPPRSATRRSGRRRSASAGLARLVRPPAGRAARRCRRATAIRSASTASPGATTRPRSRRGRGAAPATRSSTPACASCATTGWMHNRVRMIVGVVPGQGPARRLARSASATSATCSSTATWPRTSATGSGWPAPAPTPSPYFRIFNPVTQSRKFDPDGDLHPPVGARAAPRSTTRPSTRRGRSRRSTWPRPASPSAPTTRLRSSTTPRPGPARAGRVRGRRRCRGRRPGGLTASTVLTVPFRCRRAARGRRGRGPAWAGRRSGACGSRGPRPRPRCARRRRRTASLRVEVVAPGEHLEDLGRWLEHALLARDHPPVELAQHRVALQAVPEHVGGHVGEQVEGSAERPQPGHELDGPRDLPGDHLVLARATRARTRPGRGTGPPARRTPRRTGDRRRASRSTRRCRPRRRSGRARPGQGSAVGRPGRDPTRAAPLRCRTPRCGSGAPCSAGCQIRQISPISAMRSGRRGGRSSGAGSRLPPAPPRTRRPRSRSPGWPGRPCHREAPGSSRRPCGATISRRARRSGRSPAMPKKSVVRPRQAASLVQSSFDGVLAVAGVVSVRRTRRALHLPRPIRERPRRTTGRRRAFEPGRPSGLLETEIFPP